MYRVTPNFFGDPRTLIGGSYQQPQYLKFYFLPFVFFFSCCFFDTLIHATISIRVGNARKAQLCNTQVRLLLLRKECDGKSPFCLQLSLL